MYGLKMISAATTLLASLSAAAPTIRDSSDTTGPTFTLAVNSTDDSNRYYNTSLSALYFDADRSVIGVDAGVQPSPFSFSVAVNRTSTVYDNTAYYLHYLDPTLPTPTDQTVQYNNNGAGNEQFFSFGQGFEAAEFALGFQDSTEVGIYVSQGLSQFEFYICPEQVFGYTYEVLVFVTDGFQPSDGSCTPVNMRLMYL